LVSRVERTHERSWIKAHELDQSESHANKKATRRWLFKNNCEAIIS